MLNVKKTLYKILTSISSGTNYLKLPDGTLVCWGSVTIPSGVYTAYWTFPEDFIDRTNLSIQVTPLQTGTSWNVNYASTSVSQTQIGRTPNTNSDTYYILAFGRWKVGGGVLLKGILTPCRKAVGVC